MLSRFYRLFKPTKLTHLGRWDTITHENKKYNTDDFIEKNTYWGNHDHCGSEVCKIPIKKVLKTQLKKNN